LNAWMKKWILKHQTLLMATALGLAAFVMIFTHAPRVGYTRDEGFYFSAAESYSAWFKTLISHPSKAFDDKVIWRYYENNREHPVLVKNLMALSFLAFASDEPRVPTTWPRETTGTFAMAMRLPAQLFSAFAIALTFLLGTAVASKRVGLLAALLFLLSPRHFYHAQLACFDMPAVTVWLATILAWRKSLHSTAWSIATGVIWGLALAVKHNSFFIPIVLLLHWIMVSGKEFSISSTGLKLPRIPLAFFSMLILGPLVFYAHWPILWHHPIERLGWYFGFHLHHINYYWEYFGKLLTDPPFPWLYPFAVSTLTLPLPFLVLCIFGVGRVTWGLLGRLISTPTRVMGRFAGLVVPREKPGPSSQSLMGLARWDAWLLWLNTLIPFLVIAVPSVPIFGGIKHWMHAMPFAAVLAALAMERMVEGLANAWPKGGKWLYRATAALVLAPGLAGLIWIGPYGSAFYNSLAGGVSGAADLGMQRQYWSNDVLGIFPWLNENLPKGARVFFHEVTGESFHAYRRDGLLRPDIRPAWSTDYADYTVYQYHREFVDTEYGVWNKTGDRTIVKGLYLDQVPLVLVYDSRKSTKGRLAK